MSNTISSGLDGYTFRARYLPAFTVVLPAWLAFALWFPPDKAMVGTFASTGVTFVLGVVLAQIGRDAGKQRQQSLFREWGGTPTVRALSYRYHVVNGVTLARFHAALNTVVAGLQLPASEAEEKADWKGAKTKYESASDYLRSATRDKGKFRLVYAENVNYGFRRNLWGMKPGGIAIAVLGIGATTTHAAMGFVSGRPVYTLDATSGVLCVAMLTLWLLRFTKPWVKLAADEYSVQLIAASELLAKERIAPASNL